MTVLVDSWYGDHLPYETLEDQRIPGVISRVVDRSAVARGVAVWWCGRRHDIVALAGWGAVFKTVIVLERLFSRRRSYLVVLQLIVVPEECWLLVGRRSRLRARLRVAAQRLLVAPVLRRALARAHVLSSWEGERNAQLFGVGPDRFVFLPWPLAAETDDRPDYRDRGRLVVAAGRTLCDWPTVFAAARDQGWDLDVVCDIQDRGLVDRLNSEGTARVRHDIPIGEYRDLVRRAAVHMVVLHDCAASSGHRRVEDAVRGGTPLVVSGVQGLSDYVRPGETALVFRPGDHLGAREAVNRLLDDAILCDKLQAAAFDRARGWTRERYMEAIGALIEDAASAPESRERLTGGSITR